MTRSLADARRWMHDGTNIVSEALTTFDEESFSLPSHLPGWTRRHVVAHLAANADALSNLVHWAATGERTLMYASMEQRNADIETGATRSGAELTDRFIDASTRLEAGMDALTDEQWTVEVLNAQGGLVLTSETPWMRSREVMIHAVDLNAAVGFHTLPRDFLAALCADITIKRTAADEPAFALTATDSSDRWVVGTSGVPKEYTGTLAAVAGYLTGRDGAGVRTPEGEPAPPLPTWL